MRFSTITLFLSLTASALSAPIERRALKTQTYNQFQVSDGIAGNALAEVDAKFPVNRNNLAGVSAADLAIISKAAKVAEQAEVAKGGFNDVIAAAGGPGTAAGAILQIGKNKNKVLKLETDVLRLMIIGAQGGDASSLPVQQKKLDTNVALDAKAKGKASKSINFAG